MPSSQIEFKSVLSELELLETRMNRAIEHQRAIIDSVHPLQKMSAENLIRYLALRTEEIRPLQDNLHVAGLSSLQSSESHILRQLQAIQERLGKEFRERDLSKCDYITARDLMQRRSKRLFGLKKNPDIPYLMVTFDQGFLENLPMVIKLLEAGMNIARINCAHDEKDVWKNMIGLIRKASAKTGIPCNIYMDLAGPKLRTTLLGKGRKRGRVTLVEGQEVTLAEEDADYDLSTVVIGCSEPGIVRQLKVDERVLFDDGLIEGRVVSNSYGCAVVRINRISTKKSKLKVEKGMNFADSELEVPAITERDRSLIPFICQHADLVGYSFVRDADGVRELQRMLSKKKKHPHIILKIETPQAVKSFASLLIQGMKDEVFGVMIARGDLAVEIGFERMSEIQEEILWISEACHAPVIWATQVLETMNKSGIATRSEVTDAYRAAMAECVMINKGDYTIKVLKTLTDILQRSGGHHIKKRNTSRPMQIAKNYFSL
jgi:pyruvate kinase